MLPVGWKLMCLSQRNFVATLAYWVVTSITSIRRLETVAEEVEMVLHAIEMDQMEI